MKRIIALGDIHGRHNWKAILEVETYDLVVFIGDYFDSKEEITSEDQIQNFEAIIDFKKNHDDQVILLLGNHDYHYLSGVEETYTGYQREHAEEISQVLNVSLSDGLIHVMYRHENLLFTHAGITRTWYKRYLSETIEPQTLEDDINALFRERPSAFGFQYGEHANTIGDDIYQSPLWVRPQSLIADRLPGWVQIVGHTMIEEIRLYPDSEKPELAFIDSLGLSGQYLICEGRKLKRGRYAK